MGKRFLNRCETGLSIHFIVLGLALVNQTRFKHWSCQNVCAALIYLLNNIFIRFGTKLHR